MNGPRTMGRCEGRVRASVAGKAGRTHSALESLGTSQCLKKLDTVDREILAEA